MLTGMRTSLDIDKLENCPNTSDSPSRAVCKDSYVHEGTYRHKNSLGQAST